MNTTLRMVVAIALLVFATGVLAQGAAPAPAPIASEETNWSGIKADVTEFKRKGSTLTAKVKLTNSGADSTQVRVRYPGVYVLDAEAAKKYEVLKDDKGAFIAATPGGYTDTFWVDIPAGESRVMWMKFPAPPATTKAATLQIDETPPFEDLPIQDQ